MLLFFLYHKGTFPPIHMHDCTLSPEDSCGYCETVCEGKCPICFNNLERDTWSVHYPDQDGNHDEMTGKALYCSNPLCEYNLFPTE